MSGEEETTRNATTVVIFVRPRLTSGDPGASRPRRRVASLFDMVLCDEKFYCKSFSKILTGVVGYQWISGAIARKN